MHSTSLLSLLAASLACGALAAQNVVTLHSVTVRANDDVEVVWSKNFATCAHMRFNDATCSSMGPLTHVQNHFCASGTAVSTIVPLSAFVAGFGPGIPVNMVHGNNNGVQSPCVNVECDGRYGTACAGTFGPPALGPANACQPAGSTLDLGITSGVPGSLAVLAFGASQIVFPVFGCDLLVSPLLVTVVLPLDASGATTLPLALPPSAAGASLTAQAFLLDGGNPEGFAATNGLLIRIL